MNFKNNAQRKAYFAKNKDAGWHFKTNHGTYQYDNSAMPNPKNELLNKKSTGKDRQRRIDSMGGKTHELVEYESGSPSWTTGVGKLKQYDNRHGVGQRRHSGGSYSGGSIWGKDYENYGLNEGIRHEYLAHKKGISVEQEKEQALAKKTGNFKMFD